MQWQPAKKVTRMYALNITDLLARVDKAVKYVVANRIAMHPYK